VTAVVDDEQFQNSQLPGLWFNGAMAMGVARRAMAELADLGVDAEPFHGQAELAREHLDSALAGNADMSAARAGASELAVRVAAALVTATGSR
jgi:hypothetical protein